MQWNSEPHEYYSNFIIDRIDISNRHGPSSTGEDKEVRGFISLVELRIV